MLRLFKTCSPSGLCRFPRWRGFALATLLAPALVACASGGPPALGPLFADPDSRMTARAGRLVEQPQWVNGPDGIDFALYAKVRAARRDGDAPASEGETASWPSQTVSLECVVTASAQLSLCAPHGAPDTWSPERVRPYLSAMHLATLMQLAPLDREGQAVAGGRVRITIDWPDEPPVPSDAEIVPPRILNLPSPWEHTRLYPARAMEIGADGDVILICVVAASGLSEGCEVFFESVSQVGFGEASRQLYSNIRVLPPTVNGVPHRSLAMATVRWRLQ